MSRTWTGLPDQPTKRIILLHGEQGAGKDSAAEILGTYHNYYRDAFANPMRAGLLAVDPWVNLNDGEGLPWLSDYAPDAFSLISNLIINTTVSFQDLDPRYYVVRLSSLVGAIGWDHAKRFIEVRRLLQKYGTEGGRDIHGQDCWAVIGAGKIVQVLLNPMRDPYHEEYSGMVMSDLRFENEPDVIEDKVNHHFGCYLHPTVVTEIWNIVRPDNPITQKANHISESWHPSSYDFTLINDGTLEDLKSKINERLREKGNQ